MAEMLKPGLFVPGSVRLANPLAVVSRVLPSLTDSHGNWTPYAAAAELFDSVEIRTKVTPPIKLNIRSLEDPSPNPYLNQIKLALILRGPAGTKVIAPYGEVPGENEGESNLWKIGGVVVGGLFLFGAFAFCFGAEKYEMDW